MDTDLVDELERFIERGSIWDGVALEAMGAVLAAAGGPLPRALGRAFAAVRLRLGMGPRSSQFRRDVEAVVYPGLWKVLEAVRDGLPTGEQRARIQALNRRLARLFADEVPAPS